MSIFLNLCWPCRVHCIDSLVCYLIVRYQAVYGLAITQKFGMKLSSYRFNLNGLCAVKRAGMTLSTLLLLVLSGCVSAPPGDDQVAGAPSAAEVLAEPTVPIETPKIPALSAMQDSAPRSLAGQYVAVGWSDLPGWQNDDMRNVWAIFLRNCSGLMRPTGGSLTTPARATPKVWQPVCAAASDPSKAPNPNDANAVKQFFQTYLQPWRIQSGGAVAIGTATGYYEPIVKGSRTKSGSNQWPLYTVPVDLLTIDLGAIYPELAGKRVRGKVVGDRVVPYESRAELSKGNRQPPAIVYVSDPVDNFFLQVQGSGRVLLTDGLGAGTTIRLAYANHNGHPYVSIGRWLSDQGQLALAQTSMQNIRAWAKRNPGRVQEMLNANPAVVFFREEAITDPSQGPKGAYAIPLAARRSIAVDPTFVPLGSPVFLSTTMPSSNDPLNRMMFAQDTGTAIRGAARADFYWGSGDEAGALAGRMKQKTKMWVLWPKTAGVPTAR